MTDGSIDSPQSTSSLLAQAKQEVARSGELVKLIMSGVCQVDSWLIENRILPILQRSEIKKFHLALAAGDGKAKTASFIPLCDGSAFARSTIGHWLAL